MNEVLNEDETIESKAEHRGYTFYATSHGRIILKVDQYYYPYFEETSRKTLDKVKDEIDELIKIKQN